MCNRKLLLLFGLPRSGTTWVAKMIDSHPDVIYRHEPDSEYRLQIPLITLNDESHDAVIDEFSESIIRMKTIRTCGKSPFFKKSYFNPVAAKFFLMSIYMAKLAQRVGLSGQIIESINSDRSGLCLLWKSIESIGRMEAILRALPDCKMIYIMRHPCGQISSVLNGEKKNRFSSMTLSADDFGIFEKLLGTEMAKQRNLTLNSLKTYSEIERLAYRWLLYNEHALKSLESFSDRVYIVRYEDICQNPLDHLKAIFNFSGLTWHNQTESFINQSIAEESKSYYSVYKNPKVAMNKWKEQLLSSDIESIKHILQNSYSYKFYESDI